MASAVAILVDADACPGKEEVYRVAYRLNVPVTIVSNAHLRVPQHPLIARVVVNDGFDAADDWIVENAGPGDVVVSDDIPLAARCLKKGARVVGTRGRDFTEEAIGDARATREVFSQLRDQGLVGGGPAPFGPKDRSRFLDRLDTLLRAVLRSA